MRRGAFLYRSGFRARAKANAGNNGKHKGQGIPLDAYTTGMTGAWSMGRQLLTSYGGAFYTPVSGEVNVLLDQSGNSRNLTATAANTRPGVTTAGPNSRAAADFDRDPANEPILSGPQLSSIIANNNGFIVAIVQIDSYTSAAFNLFYDTLVFMALNASTTGNGIYGFNNDGAGDFTTISTAMAAGAVHVVTWRHESGTLAISIDGGTEVTVASGNTSTMTGTFRFGNAGTSSLDGKLLEMYSWSTTPSSGDRTAIINQAKTYAGI